MESGNHTSGTDLTPDWLAMRFRFDMISRNNWLERQFLHNLPQKDSLSLVDLGSGTGANFFYLSEKIPQPQHWLLVDRSKQLLTELPENFRRFANSCDADKMTYWLSRLSSGNIRFEVVEDDFYRIAPQIFESPFDAITANAVFDLSSQLQFGQLIQTIVNSASKHAQLYFTLHLNQELNFSPDHGLDDAVRCAYHQHMSRPQEFGNAMGADAVIQMIQILNAASFEVDAAESPWQISGDQTAFLRHNLAFMRSALLNHGNYSQLTAWFEARDQQLIEQAHSHQFKMQIGHQDILAKIQQSSRY